MKKNNSYRYPKTQRENVNGKRHYVFDKEKLPSVTTILDITQPAEKRESLAKWRERVGEDSAARIMNEAATRGTAMHKILEKYVLDEGYLDETTVGKQAHNMAIQVIQNGLINMTEYYGTECTLFYPGLYAGQTDLVGIHNDKETIIDFKQANRPKREEWIGDYKLQAGAYAMAHDHVHGSNIEQCVIMVCTPDLYYQEFKVEGPELRRWKHAFLKRLDMYHDLIFDEKEKAKVNMNPEDFFNGA